MISEDAKRALRATRGKDKIETVMHEFKEGTLHSGSPKGPRVSNRRQAVAIALSGAGIGRRKKKH